MIRAPLSVFTTESWRESAETGTMKMETNRRKQRNHRQLARTSLVLAAAVLVLAACSLSTPVPPTLQVSDPVPTLSSTPTARPSPSDTAHPSPTAEGGQAALLTPPAIPDSPVLEPLGDQVDIEIRSIDMIDSQTGWALGGTTDGDDHLLRTADGGLTWVDRSPPQYRPPGVERLAASAYFLDDQQGWVVYFDAARSEPGGGEARALQVWRTGDAGSTWTAGEPVGVEFIGGDGFPPYIQVLAGGQGWLMPRAGGAGMHRYPVYLLHSDDQGETWRALEDPYRGLYLQSCTKTGMAFGDDQTGIISISGCPVDGPRIEYTRDGGLTWETVILPAPEDEPDLFEASFCSMVHPANWVTPEQVFVAVECTKPDGEQDRAVHMIYSSADAGQTWQAQPYPGGALIVLSDEIHLALSRGIYRSDDGGATWARIKEVTWDGQYDFVDADQGWAVAHGEDDIALVKTTDGGETWRLLDVSLAGSGD